MSRHKVTLWSAVVVAAGVAAAVVAVTRPKPEEIERLTGVVLRKDQDPRKQVPVVNASIAADNTSSSKATSDASGLFQIRLQPKVRLGQTLALRLLHPDYQPLEINEPAGHRLYVIFMKPLSSPAPSAKGPEVAVKNARIRYAVTTITTSNIGSAVKIFEVVNRADVPCGGKNPCSPDGRWKAAIAGATLEAGGGNEFQNARVSCIAGPCPFTKIETDRYSAGGPTISVAIRNWSDTTSFLFEAEVEHTMESDVIRQSFPAIFGQAMDFTLPATGQGPSIEANVNGTDIVFPLGPNLDLSWAACSVQKAPDLSNLYHCELKPGFRFE
ncbi:MAG: carboxypeptidase regulatory-like domain-containing protein [Bryobacteraceae bacterium]